MKYILKNRGSGKTYDLMRRSAKTGEVILCFNVQNAKYVNEMMEELGLSAPKAVTYSEVTKNPSLRKEEFLIDELDLFFKVGLGLNVNAITDTPGSIELKL